MAERSVFISYSQRDRETAFEIRRLLESHGVKVWLDVIDIRVSSELLQELFDSIDKQQVFCLLLSPTSVASPWCQQEITYASSKSDLLLLPIILRSCQIPKELENVVALDARQGFEHESVSARLIRAVCGRNAVEDGVLLTQLERDLIAKKQHQEQADRELPELIQVIEPLAEKSFTKIKLEIDAHSLPDDPDRLWKLEMSRDIWQEAMSIWIAPYREGKTWPERLGFEEPDYTEFYCTDKPRLDIYFQWSKILLRMDETITDWDVMPVIRTLDFDGREVRPGEMMPTAFEYPPLNKMVKDDNTFKLMSYSHSTGEMTDIPSDSDICIELYGKVTDQELCLYRSRTSYIQDVVLESSSFKSISSQIYKNVLLGHYLKEENISNWMTKSARSVRREVQDAVHVVETKWDEFKFESSEERRYVARKRHQIANHRYTQNLKRDAMKMYLDAATLFYALCQSNKLSVREGQMMCLSTCRVVEIWLGESRADNATQMFSGLKTAVKSMMSAHPTEPDFKRFASEVEALGARIDNELGQKDRAIEHLSKRLKIYTDLFKDMPSAARRLAWLATLTSSINDLQAWGLTQCPELSVWKTELKKELGEELADRVTKFRPPNELPVWLKAAKVSSWPTKPISNFTLRYTLHLPERWSSNFELRGTHMETEHIYWGSASKDAEWLVVSFMENVDSPGTMKRWVDYHMMLGGFPVTDIHGDEARRPKVQTWNYLGEEPAFKSQMQADETHCFMGTATYQRSFVMMGRMYVLLVRRGKIAWKIVLSFMTACFDSMPEKLIDSNDHIRAGAILGELKLDGVGLDGSHAVNVANDESGA